jgi:hypothetical protein
MATGTPFALVNQAAGNALAIGNSSTASGSYGVAVGTGSAASIAGGVAIGNGANAVQSIGESGSIAIGQNATANYDQVGNYQQPGIAIGNNNSGLMGIQIGANTYTGIWPITAASAAGTGPYTVTMFPPQGTIAAGGITVGSQVTISGAGAYNGTYTVLSVQPGSTAGFTYSMASNPGTWGGTGTITRLDSFGRPGISVANRTNGQGVCIGNKAQIVPMIQGSQVTGASWSAANGGTATLVLSGNCVTADAMVAGMTVTIANVNPSGYNGTYVLTAVSTAVNSISYNVANPGAYVSGGKGSWATWSAYDVVCIGNGAAAAGLSTSINGTASGYFGCSIGANTFATGRFATAIGSNFALTFQASGDYSLTLGYECTSSGQYGTAIGSVAAANAAQALAVGYKPIASAFGATAIGSTCTASGNYATAIGYYCSCTGLGSVGLGYSSDAGSSYVVSIGYYANLSATPGSNSIAIGSSCVSPGSNSIAIGNQASTNVGILGNAIAIGFQTTAGYKSIGVGISSQSTGNLTVAVGGGTTASTYGVALGYGAKAGIRATASGYQAQATGNYATALGQSATTGSYANSTAIGYAATCTAANQVMLGTAAETVWMPGSFGMAQATKADNATGTAGQIAWDANYIYVCTSANTWKRAALSTF